MFRTRAFVLGAAAALSAAALPVSAALLGVVPGLPTTTSTAGTTAYAGGVLSVTSSGPIGTLFSNPPPTQHSSDSQIQISIAVDGNGNLVGGSAGFDLQVTGSVAAYASPLLRGEVLQFGSANGGAGSTTQRMDFRFSVAGGSLAPLYAGKDIGVSCALEATSSSVFFPNEGAAFTTSPTKCSIGPIPKPAVLLLKQVSLDGGLNYFDADTEATAVYGTIGADALYRLIVRNVGSEPLVSLVINDSTLGLVNVAVPNLPLEVGGERVLTSGTTGFEDLSYPDRCDSIGTKVNTAKVSGSGQTSKLPVESSNPAWVACEEPRIELLKQVSLDNVTFYDADSPGDADVPVGTTGADAWYRLIVRNVGSETLVNLVINDSTLGLVNVPVPGGPLPVDDPNTPAKENERVLVSGSTGFGALFYADRCDGIPGNKNNVARVEAVGQSTATKVSAENPANVRCISGPDIVLLKQVSLDGGANYYDADTEATAVYGTLGADALYRLIVRNTGDEPLVSLVINDSTLGLVNVPVPNLPLEVGGERTLTSGTAGFQKLAYPDRCDSIGTKVNTAKVSGSGQESGEPVESSNPAWVACEEPRIELLKQVSLDNVTFYDADSPGDADVPVGTTGADAWYRLIVRNVGSETLVNLVINDSTLGLVNVPVPGGPLPVDDPNTPAKENERVLVSGSTGFGALFYADRCDGIPGNKNNVARVEAVGQSTATKVSAENPANVQCGDARCVVIIDEEGVDNDFYSVEKAAYACYVKPDKLVNDTDWLDTYKTYASQYMFPAAECKANGLPYDKKLPNECGNRPLLWNSLVGAGKCGSADGPGRLALMPTGQVDDEGWFALPPKVGTGIRYADQRPAECNKYVYGQNGEHGWDLWYADFVKGVVPQACLDKVKDVMPLRNQDLYQLVGKTCVAIVYDSDINIDYKPLYANLQGERYGKFTFKVEAIEVAGSLPESKSSTSLYDLWLRILPPAEPTLPLLIKIHDHEPDSIQVTKAYFDKYTKKLTVIGTSNYKGTDTTPPYVKDVYNTAELPTPATDGDNYAYMTLSVNNPADGDKKADPTDDPYPFAREAVMTYYPSSGTYKAVITVPSGINLKGQRLSIQTDEGGAYNVYITGN